MIGFCWRFDRNKVCFLAGLALSEPDETLSLKKLKRMGFKLALVPFFSRYQLPQTLNVVMLDLALCLALLCVLPRTLARSEANMKEKKEIDIACA